MTPATKILVADDHKMARQMIVDILSTRADWQVCAQAEDGEEAVRLAKTTCPDLAILDISMPRKNGIEAAKELLEFCPNVIIVSQSLHGEKLLMQHLKQIGVKGFVSKLRIGTELIPTLEAVLKGETRFATT
jgi:DNA-binding NarL/FixJ family response regulator